MFQQFSSETKKFQTDIHLAVIDVAATHLVSEMGKQHISLIAYIERASH